MKKYLHYISLLLTVILGLASCSNEPKYGTTTPEAERTLLVYSVAANDLQSLLRRDSVEMINGAGQIAGLADRVRVLLYLAPNGAAATLSELVTVGGKAQFKILKSYSPAMASTHPARIRQVIDDVKYYRPAKIFDMVMESHATGWTPDFNEHDYTPTDPRETICFSFGADSTQGGKRDSIDIDELASVFHDGELGFLWFDACYMAGVETEYQFRNKTRMYVGYVTEIMGEGLDYEKILPMIARKEPDLVGAAKLMFDSFNDIGMPASVSVTDMSKMEALARATKPLVSLAEVPYSYWLQDYARRPYGPFYDFGQYVATSAEVLQADEDKIQNFLQALDEAVVFKAITTQSFPLQPSFNPDIYSGLSTNVPSLPGSNPEAENFWINLDWTKEVY